MAGQKLEDLERAEYEAAKVHYQNYEAASAANDKVTAAQEAYNKAISDMAVDEYDYSKMTEKQEKFQEALKELNKAKSEADTAMGKFETSAAAAQAAADAVSEKKEELRNSRTTDTSFVVLQARSECSFGTRSSVLALEVTHGVYTRQRYQMTINDIIANKNVINFCTCKSKENPKVIEAAQKVADEANATIEANKRFRDKVVDFFCKPGKTEVTDNLLAQCEGECILEFAAGAVWTKGHEKVTINDESPLLRRCELTCKYGGRIILLLSGQPE